MSDFIFSVNVTFPIFLVMVIGWVLHQIGMLDEHFVTVASGGSVNLRSKMTVSVVRLYSLRSEAVQPSWEWHLSTIFTDLLPWVR